MSICLILSFIYSGMEAGVLALSRIRIRQYARAGNRKAMVLYQYLEQPERFLWTILIGNTLANFVAVGVLVVLMHQWFGHHLLPLMVGFIVIIFLFYTFFELLPKMLFRTFPNRLCMAAAIPFRITSIVLSPLVSIVTRLSQSLLHWTGGKTFTGDLFGNRDEMRMVMQESAQGLTSEERGMINRVLDLQNITVRQVTIPMEQVIGVAMDTPMSEVLRRSQEKRVTRLPVFKSGNSRSVVGVLSMRTVLYQPDFETKKMAGDYVKPALYLEDGMRLEEALKRMQRSGQRLAIVLGRDRREIGIVSLQDILKVIFGEVSL
jgi:magnesium and cobalt exporter, CNNM family